MKNKSTIKIIAGKFKGTHLEMPPSTITRSSKSILKESLFNVLGQDIVGSCFIEAFAGIGSIGLEALSRGANEALFFEQNPNSFQVLKKNISQFYSKDPSIIAKSFLGDTFELLPQAIKKNDTKKIIYLDPPFNTRENCADIYEKCVSLLQSILNSNLFLVIFEHLSNYKLPENIAHFSIIRQKKFGKSSLSYYALSQNIKETNG
ncbi:16S rRNA (guanine(966)-N(2))-methyltransferase RsmD [Helicobacter sp. 12S02232-10]|uniref:16S rRNA (guanine(966)-N(2))-methyltransferase RsmD n=1 Tax=Helicobacter sp. 12S02232-10 TaxID=1476197 RepID=UPI000BA63269|nr:16S rRNA (guanine(966)-N(2))-methyltransferase RsmD [Helicobacter sp. 12S02232-10]PAF48937.1 16S rRNA (guanine(966)-N(2))-methyltransferase RsmD [Helicobacter sp. 12S02232-10]